MSYRSRFWRFVLVTVFWSVLCPLAWAVPGGFTYSRIVVQEKTLQLIRRNCAFEAGEQGGILRMRDSLVPEAEVAPFKDWILLNLDGTAANDFPHASTGEFTVIQDSQNDFHFFRNLDGIELPYISANLTGPARWIRLHQSGLGPSLEIVDSNGVQHNFFYEGGSVVERDW